MRARAAAELVLYPLAMVALAAVVFGLFAGIIRAGNWLLHAVMGALTWLPAPLAFALAVLATAAAVTAVTTRALDGRRARPGRSQPTP